MKRAVAILVLVLGCGGRSPSGASEYDAMAAELTTAADEPSPTQVVAEWEGGQLTYADVQHRIGSDLRTMEIDYRVRRYERVSQSLEGLVDEALLEAEAAKRGLSSQEALLVIEVEDKVIAPTEDDVAALYPEVQTQLSGATLDEARPVLYQELYQRALADRYATFVREVRTAAKLDLTLPYPELPRIDVQLESDDPVLGDADAPVTVVQFAEYQCYYCNKVNPTIKRLVEAYPGRVRVVFKDFPLTGHTRAIPAAVAAHCAGEQENFWEMSDVLLGNQQALEDDDFKSYAAALSLDVGKFEKCRNSGRYEPSILADLRAGRDAGVEATPTFFVNGLVLSGAQPYDRFAAIVERELKQ